LYSCKSNLKDEFSKRNNISVIQNVADERFCFQYK